MADNLKAASLVATGAALTLAFPVVRDSIFEFLRDAVIEGMLGAAHAATEMQEEAQAEQDAAVAQAARKEPTILDAGLFRDRAENGVAD